MLLCRRSRGCRLATRARRSSKSARRPRRAIIFAWSSSSRSVGMSSRLRSVPLGRTAESASSALSPKPAAASSSACSCASSARSSSHSAFSTSSRRPAIARFHLLSSRASMRTRSLRARCSRATISGSSMLGAVPLARCTTSALSESLQRLANICSVPRPLSSRAFGA